ncbi:MAG: cysteine synthase [Clostridiales bacterium GWB2_37_7]|nr:MAG: cysteine synthase [Clostridiales bacterium GWB2_37_7]
MNYYNSIHELIGKTPIVKLNNLGLSKNVNLFAKLELWNPGGSVKDRIGEYMIKDAEVKGILKKGGTIVESTAGNTGIGVAIAALNKGYRVIFAVPEKFSKEKLSVMAALGAELVITSREEGMLGAGKKAQELISQIDGAITLKQFENPANPLAHYETTGPEIYESLEGNIDYLVAGAGSGGTFSGVVRYIKERKPDIKGILVDPYGSTMGGGEEGCYNIEGIGNNFIADTMDMSLVDEVIKVNDEEAFSTARLLMKKEGIMGGSSSGAALFGALKLSEKITSGNIVVILPDRGDRYFSKELY